MVSASAPEVLSVDTESGLRELRIGEVTVREGMDGYWNSISYGGRQASAAYERLLRGQGTSREYVDAVHQEIADRGRAHELSGKPARGPIGRFLIRRRYRQRLALNQAS